MLKDRWLDLWRRLNASGDPIATFDELSSRYSEAHRAYHTLEHVQNCLAELDWARAHCARPDEIELALWYHDVIYDAHRDDNEKRSAELAKSIASAAGLPADTIERVANLILATEHEALPTDPDQGIMVDADLAGLGYPHDQFDRNGRLVRQEYNWVAEEQYNARRNQLFQRLLDRPSIYATDVFKAKYEEPARRNLERTLNGD